MERATSLASLSSSGDVKCRICWGSETDEAAGGSPLISPCNCRGSVGLIHLHCLQHYLEVKRQQGMSRQRTVRCEVCNGKYKASLIPSAPGSAPLLPRLWSDPYALASLAHAAWRAYVVSSGLYYALKIYASINKGIGQQQLLLHTPRGAQLDAARALPPSPLPVRLLHSSSRALRVGGPSLQGAPPPPSGRVGGPVQQQQQRAPRHLSLSLPVGPGGGRERVDGSLLATIRERFDKATMVQVYWYTGLMGLWPTPGNADAFAGMAVGATVGGMVAQLVFLPMLGSGKLAALGCSATLLLRCLLRLLAAEACQARGYRLLAGLIRGLMQRWQRLRRRQQQQGQLGQQQEQGVPVGG